METDRAGQSDKGLNGGAQATSDADLRKLELHEQALNETSVSRPKRKRRAAVVPNDIATVPVDAAHPSSSSQSKQARPVNTSISQGTTQSEGIADSNAARTKVRKVRRVRKECFLPPQDICN